MYNKPLVHDADVIVDGVAEAEPPDDQIQNHFKIAPAVKSRVPGLRVVRVRVAAV